MSDQQHHDNQELTAARDHLRVVDALARALADPLPVLTLLAEAKDPAAAGIALQERFGFNAVEAAAVLDLQLRYVTAQRREQLASSRDELASEVQRLDASGPDSSSGPRPA